MKMFMMATLGKVLFGSSKLRKRPIGLNAEMGGQCLKQQQSSWTCHPVSEMACLQRLKWRKQDSLKHQIQKSIEISTEDLP